VFELFRHSMAGDAVALPDLAPIRPYLGFVTIVILRPGDLVGSFISTPHLPALSILQDDHFVPAPEGTSPAAQNVARIFDVIAATTESPPITHGTIPLSSEQPEFQQQRYWRLPVKFEAILAVLLDQIDKGDYDSEEIICAQKPLPCSRCTGWA
jgi:hypothetical protein